MDGSSKFHLTAFQCFTSFTMYVCNKITWKHYMLSNHLKSHFGHKYMFECTLTFTPTGSHIKRCALWEEAGVKPQTYVQNLQTPHREAPVDQEASCCEVPREPQQHRSVWFQRPSAARTGLMSHFTAPTEHYRHHNKNVFFKLWKVKKEGQLPQGLICFPLHRQHSYYSKPGLSVLQCATSSMEKMKNYLSRPRHQVTDES